MRVLFAVKVNEPAWAEQLITEQEELIIPAKIWASENGFNRFRIAEIDLTVKPDFVATINK